MSAAFLKTKLKALKESLAAKEWSTVSKAASDILSSEANNYNARVFLSLALFNLERFDEAEESYKKAIEISSTQPLARQASSSIVTVYTRADAEIQGLASFYEKRARYSDYAWTLLELMQLFEASGDATKYAETLQKLIAVRRAHGTRPEIISALAHLLPSSPSFSLLRTLPPANPTAPTASTVHTTQLAMISILPTLLEVIQLVESEERTAIENEVKKRRQRLGGPTLSAAATRLQVEGQVMRTSMLPQLYRQVLDDPDASGQDDLRRDMEKRLLVHLRTLLRALPSSFDAKDVDLKRVEKRVEVKREEEIEKGRVRKEVEELASGMVLIGIPEEVAWMVELEWSDRPGVWDDIDWRELSRYAALFPLSGLGRIAEATHRRFLVVGAGDDEVESTPPPTADEMADIIEAGLASSPDSLTAHLIAAKFFTSEKEWDAVIQVSEAGLSVLERIEAEIGRALPKSRRTLDSYLAIALVHFDPPTHHLRAVRLIDTLIASSPSPDLALLIAKGSIFQHAEKWIEAVGVWDVVLASSVANDLRSEVQGDRAWSLYKAGRKEEARDGLSAVVREYSARKTTRDEERKEKEKVRSKAGLERPEGLEEGETTVEAGQRAEAWWRLGECLWDLGENDNSLTAESYDAFISSIRASPSYAPPFTSLGIYYRSLAEPDFERSSKCFQKAFELDGGQEVAARFLAEEFASLSEWDLVEVIARRVVDGNRGKASLGGKAAQRLAWAWKAIGGAELNSKKYPQAIVALQAALRGAPNDVHTWIKLGVAYRSSGKYIAALKVFDKALTIDPASWYAKFSIGDVQREIGLLEPALKAFRGIIDEHPTELGVRVVLAETALALGLDELKGGFLARAEESFIEALKETATIIDAGSATRIAWKVAGDTLTGLGKLPEPTLLDVSRPLAVRILAAAETHDVDAKIEGMDTITTAILQDHIHLSESPSLFSTLAVVAYKMRVLLETQNESSIGSAWFDLGISLSDTRRILDLDLPTLPADTLNQSIRCLKFALHKEPLNSIFWNALGVLSFDLSPRLSQHCFIKSIEHNSRSAVSWTNLGLFYLVQGDEDLANQSFLKAQVIDPDWAAAWVGQAALADLAGHIADASVLLEHASSLGGSTPEADIGYATRAYHKYRSTPEPPPATAALSGPLFALTRYLSHRPDDVSGLHLNALLLEQIGDLPTACASLEKAAAILEQLYEVDESPQVEAQFIIAQTNLGRVRLASLDYEGALAAFEAGQSLLNVTDEGEELNQQGLTPMGGLSRKDSILLLTECKLGSAMASYGLDDADTAVQVLESALEDIEGLDGERRADLAIALGRVYWSIGDEDRAFGSFMDSPDIMQGLGPLFVNHSIHALGIVTNDRALLSNLTRLNKSIRFDGETTHLTTLQHLRAGNHREALSSVSRSLHAVPWSIEPRRAFAKLLLRLPSVSGDPTSSTNLESCSRFIRSQMFLVEGEDAKERAWRCRSTAVVSCGLEGGEEAALRGMEKALFIVPWSVHLRADVQRLRDAVES